MRDSVRSIEKTVERQTVLHHWGGDQDVFGLYREGGFIEAIVLLVRNGKLSSTRGWSFQDLEFADEDVLADLLTQYYAGARFIPDEVILPVLLEDAAVRADLLSERRGKAVEVFVPQRGDKVRLLEMAMENARQSFASRRDNESTREKMLDELRAKLHLRNLPKRIECYDISNLQGSMVVGSQATFDEGEPQKALYRRYRIRTVEGQDDFASLVRGPDPTLETRAGGAGISRSVGDRRRQGPAQRRDPGAEGIQSERSDRSGFSGQAARPQRRSRSRRHQVRRARVPAQSQGSDHPAAQFDRALRARAGARRGPSVCDHLQSRPAAARAAALGAGRHRWHWPGAAARTAAPFRQPAANSRGLADRNWRASRASMRNWLPKSASISI